MSNIINQSNSTNKSDLLEETIIYKTGHDSIVIETTNFIIPILISMIHVRFKAI